MYKGEEVGWLRSSVSIFDDIEHLSCADWRCMLGLHQAVILEVKLKEAECVNTQGALLVCLHFRDSRI